MFLQLCGDVDAFALAGIDGHPWWHVDDQQPLLSAGHMEDLQKALGDAFMAGALNGRLNLYKAVNVAGVGLQKGRRVLEDEHAEDLGLAKYDYIYVEQEALETTPGEDAPTSVGLLDPIDVRALPSSILPQQPIAMPPLPGARQGVVPQPEFPPMLPVAPPPEVVDPSVAMAPLLAEDIPGGLNGRAGQRMLRKLVKLAKQVKTLKQRETDMQRAGSDVVASELRSEIGRLHHEIAGIRKTVAQQQAAAEDARIAAQAAAECSPLRIPPDALPPTGATASRPAPSVWTHYGTPHPPPAALPPGVGYPPAPHTQGESIWRDKSEEEVRQGGEVGDGSPVTAAADNDGRELQRELDGWLEIYDAETGRYYYANEELGTTTWDVADTPFGEMDAAQAKGVGGGRAVHTPRDVTMADKAPIYLQRAHGGKEGEEGDALDVIGVSPRRSSGTNITCTPAAAAAAGKVSSELPSANMIPTTPTAYSPLHFRGQHSQPHGGPAGGTPQRDLADRAKSTCTPQAAPADEPSAALLAEVERDLNPSISYFEFSNTVGLTQQRQQEQQKPRDDHAITSDLDRMLEDVYAGPVVEVQRVDSACITATGHADRGSSDTAAAAPPQGAPAMSHEETFELAKQEILSQMKADLMAQAKQEVLAQTRAAIEEEVEEARELVAQAAVMKEQIIAQAKQDLVDQAREVAQAQEDLMMQAREVQQVKEELLTQAKRDLAEQAQQVADLKEELLMQAKEELEAQARDAARIADELRAAQAEAQAQAQAQAEAAAATAAAAAEAAAVEAAAAEERRERRASIPATVSVDDFPTPRDPVEAAAVPPQSKDAATSPGLQCEEPASPPAPHGEVVRELLDGSPLRDLFPSPDNVTQRLRERQDELKEKEDQLRDLQLSLLRQQEELQAGLTMQQEGIRQQLEELRKPRSPSPHHESLHPTPQQPQLPPTPPEASSRTELPSGPPPAGPAGSPHSESPDSHVHRGTGPVEIPRVPLPDRAFSPGVRRKPSPVAASPADTTGTVPQAMRTAPSQSIATTAVDSPRAAPADDASRGDTSHATAGTTVSDTMTPRRGIVDGPDVPDHVVGSGSFASADPYEPSQPPSHASPTPLGVVDTTPQPTSRGASPPAGSTSTNDTRSHATTPPPTHAHAQPEMMVAVDGESHMDLESLPRVYTTQGQLASADSIPLQVDTAPPPTGPDGVGVSAPTNAETMPQVGARTRQFSVESDPPLRPTVSSDVVPSSTRGGDAVPQIDDEPTGELEFAAPLPAVRAGSGSPDASTKRMMHPACPPPSAYDNSRLLTCERTLSAEATVTGDAQSTESRDVASDDYERMRRDRDRAGVCNADHPPAYRADTLTPPAGERLMSSIVSADPSLFATTAPTSVAAARMRTRESAVSAVSQTTASTQTVQPSSPAGPRAPSHVSTPPVASMRTSTGIKTPVLDDASPFSARGGPSGAGGAASPRLPTLTAADEYMSPQQGQRYYPQPHSQRSHTANTFESRSTPQWAGPVVSQSPYAPVPPPHVGGDERGQAVGRVPCAVAGFDAPPYDDPLADIHVEEAQDENAEVDINELRILGSPPRLEHARGPPPRLLQRVVANPDGLPLDARGLLSQLKFHDEWYHELAYETLQQNHRTGGGGSPERGAGAATVQPVAAAAAAAAAAPPAPAPSTQSATPTPGAAATPSTAATPPAADVTEADVDRGLRDLLSEMGMDAQKLLGDDTFPHQPPTEPQVRPPSRVQAPQQVSASGTGTPGSGGSAALLRTRPSPAVPPRGTNVSLSALVDTPVGGRSQGVPGSKFTRGSGSPDHHAQRTSGKAASTPSQQPPPPPPPPPRSGGGKFASTTRLPVPATPTGVRQPSAQSKPPQRTPQSSPLSPYTGSPSLASEGPAASPLVRRGGGAPGRTPYRGAPVGAPSGGQQKATPQPRRPGLRDLGVKYIPDEAVDAGNTPTLGYGTAHPHASVSFSEPLVKGAGGGVGATRRSPSYDRTPQANKRSASGVSMATSALCDGWDSYFGSL